MPIFRTLLRRRIQIFTERWLSTGNSDNRQYVEIPEPIYRYAVSISKITGLPLEEVLQSRPVRNMIQRYRKKVRVSL